MKIQIDGINTMNKGAELMLVTILQQIEEKYPESVIYLNPNSTLDPVLLPSTVNKKVIRWVFKYSRFINAFLRRLKLTPTYFTNFYVNKNIDLVLDASGFQYADQWKYSDKNIEKRKEYYKSLKRQNIKTVFLPQAFGPFNTNEGRKPMEAIKDNVNILIARDEVSYGNLIDLGFSPNKLWVYPDFTFGTKANHPEHYEHLKDAVCVIPNMKMISHSPNNKEKYLNLLINIIELFQEKSIYIFLLNHEGSGDMQLCKLLNDKLQKPVEIVNNLLATEIKGVIANSSMVISSRFHGVASSLSSGVPCLCTSWNHKYKMLYRDFQIDNHIIKLDTEWAESKQMIMGVFENKEEEHKKLKSAKEKLIIKNREMWARIWKELEN